MTETGKGMTLIVKTVTRITVGLILLFGIYIVLHGHLSHGGGFAGGVIIALSFVHLMLAFGKDIALKHASESVATLLQSIGVLIFLGVAVIGFGAGHFFASVFADKGEAFALFSAGTIPLCNIAIALAVGGGLFAVFVALVLLKIGSKETE